LRIADWPGLRIANFGTRIEKEDVIGDTPAGLGSLFGPPAGMKYQWQNSPQPALSLI